MMAVALMQRLLTQPSALFCLYVLNIQMFYVPKKARAKHQLSSSFFLASSSTVAPPCPHPSFLQPSRNLQSQPFWVEQAPPPLLCWWRCFHLASQPLLALQPLALFPLPSLAH